MNVETIQKINDLALSLLNQGLASNREEAARQAEDIFKKRYENTGTSYSELRGRMEEVASVQKVNDNSNKENMDISQTQIKEILTQNTNFLVKTIKEFQEKMSLMEREIVQLKHRAMSTQATREIVSENKSEQSAPVRGEDKPSTSHPRSGNYKDADVSIEKYFYMGNR